MKKYAIVMNVVVKKVDCILEKIRPVILCDSSARQRIHMKHQALFSLTDKSKKKMLGS